MGRAISVIVYGRPTADPVNPCSDFPPVALSITVRLIPRAHDTQVITSEIKDPDCELDANSQVVRSVRHGMHTRNAAASSARCDLQRSLLLSAGLPRSQSKISRPTVACASIPK
jgi:hypothetical protein